MLSLNRVRLSGIALAAVVLSLAAPGCGSDSNSVSPPSTEVKIVPPTDASGKAMPIEGEGSLTAPKK